MDDQRDAMLIIHIYKTQTNTNFHNHWKCLTKLYCRTVCYPTNIRRKGGIKKWVWQKKCVKGLASGY